MEKPRKIKPELLSGFRDFLPESMILKQEAINKLIAVFERFGFLPLDTPCLERSSVLGTDQNEFKMEVYRFNDNFKGQGQDVSLRFDLTVPLARVIAAYPEIIKPFKRYQYGKVFRKEKAQTGRYRELAQLDMDIVGSNSILADIEIIQLIYQSFQELGIDGFLIRVNNRKILNGLPQVCGFEPEKAQAVFRVLDKLEKIGLEQVVKEWQTKPTGPKDDSACGLTSKNTDKLKDFLELNRQKDEIIPNLKKFFQGVAVSEQGIKEIEQIVQGLNQLEIQPEKWQIDLSVARGLAYYTGPVFETNLTELPEIGAMFSGGRYDQLVKRFTGEKLPAVGASLGVDRLIAALEKMGKLQANKSTAQILIARLEPELDAEIMLLAKELREKGINTEIYLGESGTMLKEQVIYAAKREIPYLIILGQKEKEQNKIKLKDMRQRTEELLTKQELIKKLGA